MFKHGERYKFRFMQMQEKEMRVAFAGDSVTVGCCGRGLNEVLASPAEKRLTDQDDGTSGGMWGYPYFLHELFRVHNSSTKYTFMNFGSTGAFLTPGVNVTGTETLPY